MASGRNEFLSQSHEDTEAWGNSQGRLKNLSSWSVASTCGQRWSKAKRGEAKKEGRIPKRGVSLITILLRSLITINWKAVRQNLLRKNNKDPLKIELFNLRDDIGESRDVATEHPEIVTRMRTIMDAEHTHSDIFAMPPLDR